MHTFLFEEGLWAASGEYVDEAMNRAALEGETRVTHRPGQWLNEGRMRIELGGREVVIENRYRVIPPRLQRHQDRRKRDSVLRLYL